MSIKKQFIMLTMGLSLLLLWTYAHPAVSILPSNIAKAAGPKPLIIQPEEDDASANLPPIAPQAQFMAQSMVVITSSADSFLSGLNTSNNAGGATDFAAGVTGATGSNSLRRGVIRFDIAGSGIPPGSTINSVTLSLNVVRWPELTIPPGGTDSFFQIHRITRGWNEGNKTGNSGAAATLGEVTWNHAVSPIIAWTSAGGDFVGTPSATSNSIVQACLCAYTWGSTTQMVADVQGWLDSPSTNFGWLLKNSEAVIETTRRFASKEHTTATPPTLTITYASPVYLPIVIK